MRKKGLANTEGAGEDGAAHKWMSLTSSQDGNRTKHTARGFAIKCSEKKCESVLPNASTECDRSRHLHRDAANTALHGSMPVLLNVGVGCERFAIYEEMKQISL